MRWFVKQTTVTCHEKCSTNKSNCTAGPFPLFCFAQPRGHKTISSSGPDDSATGTEWVTAQVQPPWRPPARSRGSHTEAGNNPVRGRSRTASPAECVRLRRGDVDRRWSATRPGRNRARSNPRRRSGCLLPDLKKGGDSFRRSLCVPYVLSNKLACEYPPKEAAKFRRNFIFVENVVTTVRQSGTTPVLEQPEWR